MNLPQSDILSTSRLGKIFSNTVATYKYFWFVSIMQIHAKEDCQVMESHQSRARSDERDASVCASKG